MPEKKFYITTPIYYVNDQPHLGHAYTTLLADVLARWHRQRKQKTFFLVGTDEHGIKISQAAKKANKSEKDFVDEKAKIFQSVWQDLNIKYDNFLRTSNLEHILAVQKAISYLKDKGFIYKDYYEGLYCSSCEQYKMADDLIDGKCPDHQKIPQVIKEESYFFKLSDFEKTIKEKISSNKVKIVPESRKQEILTFLKKGLKDISISRKNVQWGIPLPFDKEYTLYVWIDAFLNYLTGLGWQGIAGKKPAFFPPDLQLMGKDILRVHATIWLALLLALKLPLPKKFFVHGYFTIEGQKMSKTIGNVVLPEDLIKKFGVDGTRYLLLSSLSFGQDSDISWEKLTKKYNAELANNLGNLVARAITLNSGIKAKIIKTKIQNKNLEKLFEEIKIKEILEMIWEKISWANKYVEEKKLWELVKKNPKEGKKILSKLLSLIFEISKLIEPFMPTTSEKILQQLKTGQVDILFPRIK